MTKNNPNPNMQMPKWLLCGLIAKGVIVAAVIAGVVIYVMFQ
ncbi:hypothetical protein [Rhizobium sp. CECT 9324]|nr:hypothetical protein [Rhizobium sp. CECT 9324]CAH0340188.1 hypothetical protein RHI9324_01845 [Rhizobium sp. CECT 9324]